MNLQKYSIAFFALAAFVALATIACGGETSPTSTPTQISVEARQTQIASTPQPTNTPAVVIVTPTPIPLPIYGDGILEVHDASGWLNSDEFKITEKTAENQVVLVDFWTYTCVNCLRTLPFLKEWQAKYSDRGLVILGVHTPEFEFEKEIQNVREAIQREGIEWPVVLDNDFGTWNSFSNRFWPAKYLIGVGGQLRYQHFGEGAYVEVEQEIRDALTEAGHDISDIPIGTINDADRDPVANSVTRKLYGGYERNYNQNGIYAGQEDYYIEPDATRLYTDIATYTPQQWFIQGLWTNGPESIIHARETANLEDHIAFYFAGRSANVVLSPSKTESFNVYIELDDRPLTSDEAGLDIEFDDEGRSYIKVDEPRLYAIIETPEFGEHIVKLSSNSDDFAIFAFTFGINESGI
jgi:thiol-disulfide isomerase/thioredoxin